MHTYTLINFFEVERKLFRPICVPGGYSNSRYSKIERLQVAACGSVERIKVWSYVLNVLLFFYLHVNFTRSPKLALGTTLNLISCIKWYTSIQC